MDLSVVALGIVYFVVAVATFLLLRKAGMRIASLVYAFAVALLALYLPVAVGCNLMVRLVQVFADASTAAYFAEFINEPFSLFNSYATITYLAALAISALLTFSAIFVAVKFVGAVRRFFHREPATFIKSRNHSVTFPSKRSLHTNVPLRYVFCRYNC